jgi:hypothetical protein
MLNSAFNAQVWRVIIIVVQVAVKIYVGATEALSMKLSLPPNLVEKLVWVRVI